MPKVAVSGIVTDSALNPVKTAHVFFVRAGFALNSNITVDDFRQYFDMNDLKSDFRLEGNSSEVFQTEVDPTGRYSLPIPKGADRICESPGLWDIVLSGQTNLL